ncbi:Protein FAM44A [Operophtera brumata]|uniref:Protein FAM44A n=1 Tax=Operophtera brumata TaxID=104452 RepID=A0A0L7LP38_OPEBR|nr:Protein FAM44A [Operophtera brumata]
MAHLQYMPGDPRLVDQLVYELKSKGIFDQFRKDCIADVDTRPAYQNLRQRVESSVSTFLGNYLEQGVERIVDQVVNPKVSSVFIPQVEDLVYNYLGIPRKRTPKAEENTKDLLPTDLEAVSPGSVKSNDEESKDSESKVQDMDIDSEEKPDTTEDMSVDPHKDDLVEVSSDTTSMDKSAIPLPTEEIKLENIPAPDNSPKPAKIELDNIELPSELKKPAKFELKNIELPREPNVSTDIPLPDEVLNEPITKESHLFKPVVLHSEESNSSSGSSIRRNMSPLTPVRNFDDENSCDAQQAFENNSNENDHKEPNTFRFNIENKDSINDSSDGKTEKKETEQLAYQFTNQVNINAFNTPMYDDSSNSHNLQIDYESDANTNISKVAEIKPEIENSEEFKKERKDDKKSHKSSHRSRDSSRHSSSKDKHSNSRDSSRHDKKYSSSKDDKSKSSKERERSKDSSKHKTSHKSTSSSKDKHRSSSSSHRHSSKSSDDRKSSSKDKHSEKDKEKSSEKDKSSRDRKEAKSSSHKDKDRKSSKKEDKDKKKEKKDTDDRCSSSGRGNNSRRSTDRDSNDGSSSSKGSQSQNNSKSTTDNKKETKGSKSENTSTSGESTSPSDKDQVITNKLMQFKPIVRVDNHLETPIANPPRLPFVPDVTLKKPKFANNFEEAKKMMKMRKFLAEEQKRMNQEAALLLEFQANVRPNLSQVYSSIPGPELEFACITHKEPDIVALKMEKVDEETDRPKETLKIEAIDAEVPETANVIINEHLENKQVTIDIINDIIGVPVNEESTEQKSIEISKDIGVEIESDETLNISIEEDFKNDDSYDENKPFSELVDQINEYGKTSDKSVDPLEESIAEIVDQNLSTEFVISVTAETLTEADVSQILEMKEELNFSEKELQYFAEHEKFNAELEKHKFSNFLKDYIESTSVSNKMYLMDCDTYEENIVKEVASKFGEFEIVNYFKNNNFVPTSKNIVKDVSLSAEISLPINLNDYELKSPLFSPIKSECSFELSSDYDAKLEEIVNKKSRQEVMEIILGGIIDESPSKMPTIDYYTEMSDTETTSIVQDSTENTILSTENTIKTVDEEVAESTLKRHLDEETLNSSRSVLTPNKIRKMSDSDQISSTTEALPNSPSSDKSVENYTLNTPATPNGKLKATPRSKVQRYDTSDLYKPKLHYLSRRNNIR